MLENWVIAPTCLPLVLRRCHAWPSERSLGGGDFRVNASHRLLDAWLLALCAACGDPAKLTLLERMNVRLHTTRGAGPATRQRRRTDGRTTLGFGRAMPRSHRPRLGQRPAPQHRRIGSL
ncbi:DUF1062 domain-containing protein [Catellatospora sp. NEAU-YM18]|nr:DUF1062 domain-containing protein [Catellatospora tritici]